ncbi:SUKH-4 family immunity protein [Streptomyces sp. NPDC005989]|uniref:SUKH-4 family immunity protein n=1 Tax=Streptomyces sp. NPDC005989 TaxID=3156727 RepID=UPI0033D601BB
MPLTHQDLLNWATEVHIERAGLHIVAGWDIPANHKAMLVEVGIPRCDLVDRAAYQPGTAPALTPLNGPALYRLTVADQDSTTAPGLSFGAQPGTGAVYCMLNAEEAWFTNSSIPLWLQSLHLYGERANHCDLLIDPDTHDEEAVRAELQRLADDIKELDPPAFAGYLGFIWPEYLDRWLY